MEGGGQSELQRYLKEYEKRDDVWLLDHCREERGKRRMAMYTILVNRGYKAEDLDKSESR